MTEVFTLTKEHALWDDVSRFAQNCSWKAGPVLAKKMRQNAFLAWERVFAACVDGETAGFCTFSQKDELPDIYDFTPFIGFVFVGKKYRGNRISQLLIHKAMDYAHALGYEKIYILSGETGLYEKYGFVKLGDYETTCHTVDQLFVRSTLV